MPLVTKRCAKCKKERAIVLFNRNNASKDGRQSYCRDCMKPLNRIQNRKRYGGI